jgi:hypothetical protein
MNRELPPVFQVLPQPAQEFVKEALRLGLSPQEYQGNEAAACCDKALELIPADASVELKRAAAGIDVLRGQILEREQQNPRLDDALQSYDRAIALLDAPGANEAMVRESAVAWMNRGNVLQRKGEPESLNKAIEAYNVTIERLRPIAPAEPLGRSTLGAALLNKGTALQRLNTQESHTEAAKVYEEAIQLLSVRPQGFEEHFARLSAGAQLNRGGALLAAFGPERVSDVLAGVRAVLDEVTPVEERDLNAADTSMRARRLACEALGILLQSTANAAPPERPDWVSNATDHAERALQLAQHWEHKGVLGFRPAVPWFLHFAATVYAHHQPQFLSEFLLDTLDAAATPPPWKAAPQLKQIALQTIERLRAHLRSRLFENLGGAEAERWNELLADLQQAESRLAVRPA